MVGTVPANCSSTQTQEDPNRMVALALHTISTEYSRHPIFYGHKAVCTDTSPFFWVEESEIDNALTLSLPDVRGQKTKQGNFALLTHTHTHPSFANDFTFS